MRVIGLAFFLCLVAVSPQDLVFVHCSDPHLGLPENDARLVEVWKRLEKHPMKAEIAFIAITGDLLADCLDDPVKVASVKEILSKAPFPVKVVAGNHDLIKKDFPRRQSLWEAAFGPLAYAEQHAGVRCAFFWSGPLAANFQVEGYDPLAALDRWLAPLPATAPTLLFHHFPFGEDTWGGKTHPGWKESQRETFLAKAREWNTAAILTGHFHRDEIHHYGAITEYTVPSIAGYWGRQASWRICRFTEGKLSYCTSYLE